MADLEVDQEVTFESRVKNLENELDTEKQRRFIAESVIAEYRQALADAQLALAQTNAKIKLLTQPVG